MPGNVTAGGAVSVGASCPTYHRRRFGRRSAGRPKLHPPHHNRVHEPLSGGVASCFDLWDWVSSQASVLGGWNTLPRRVASPTGLFQWSVMPGLRSRLHVSDQKSSNCPGRLLCWRGMARGLNNGGGRLRFFPRRRAFFSSWQAEQIVFPFESVAEKSLSVMIVEHFLHLCGCLVIFGFPYRRVQESPVRSPAHGFLRSGLCLRRVRWSCGVCRPGLVLLIPGR